ncbi:unnamed protein product [Nippostrongylus brasiliensis]|uniref:Cyclin-dependent kinases regulatory subunit n=1 Tax=Nippostrongylus brasiliensis TaxID=27835 RepID=A0A0N4Y9Y9_NIPBR|nr:unnamed protein product [Nippostrongylus brasiliensis]
MGLLLLAGCAACMGPLVRHDKLHLKEKFVASEEDRKAEKLFLCNSETLGIDAVLPTPSDGKVLRRQSRSPSKPCPLKQEEIPEAKQPTDCNQSVTDDDAPTEDLLPAERMRRAFGRNDYLLPENFKTLRRSDIPVTYRLHDDLLRYYRTICFYRVVVKIYDLASRTFLVLGKESSSKADKPRISVFNS